VNEQRKKLSKRKDPVATESYRDQGYLPDAFVNYLALLGWSPRGDEEIVPRSTLIEQFRLEDVSHSPAFFDVKKLTHMNGEYIRASAPRSSSRRARRGCDRGRLRLATERPRAVPWSEAQFDAATLRPRGAARPRARRDAGRGPDMVEFFFLEDLRYDEPSFAKVITNDPVGKLILEGAIVRYERLSTWDAASLHERRTTTRRRAWSGTSKGSGADPLCRDRHSRRASTL
jgi:glutamyl-tRNA synthetase